MDMVREIKISYEPFDSYDEFFDMYTYDPRLIGLDETS